MSSNSKKRLQSVLTLTIVLGLSSVLAAGFYAMHYRGYRALSVQSGSMVPTIAVGDGIIVKQVPLEQLHEGDVITFQQGSGLISHRIVKLNYKDKTLLTKGDHNKFVDNAIPASMVMGKAVAVVPYLGKITTLLKSPLALLLLIYIPSVVVILWEARSLQQSLIRPYRLAGRSTR